MSLRRASSSSVVTLGQVLGRGGEGSVHVVHQDPHVVAKIYKKPPLPAKVEKLRSMARRHTPELLRVAAWPQELLVDEQGTVRGFLMGRITSRQDAHRLYSPRSRRRTFPDADFRFLVRAATNLARAFAHVHAAGHVIGDVNHGNALIGRDGTATLIDCDSFQVSDHGRVFHCDVGSPLFTPPELQGKAFRGLRREVTHDSFGLAVLLFHLLFQGRHPFAGQFADPEMTVERAIAESRFAYGANHPALGTSPPPGTLPLSNFGEPIAGLFERSFAPPFDTSRPSPAEWIEPLRTLEASLRACPAQPRHFHPPGPTCCWCTVEHATGVRLFEAPPAERGDTVAEAMTAEQLWKRIEQEPAPRTFPALPEFADRAGMPRVGFGLGWVSFWSVAMVTGGYLSVVPGVLVDMAARISVFAGTAVFFGLGVFLNRRAQATRALHREWLEAVDSWKEMTSASEFFLAKARLRERADALQKLERKHALEIDRLKRQLVSQQRHAFLDSFDIGQAQFTIVSPTHVQRLQARGIRSAGDVDRHRRRLADYVPKKAAEELRAWADRCSGAFAFDHSDPAFLRLAEPTLRQHDEQRRRILSELQEGPSLLARKYVEVDQARKRADDLLQQKRRALDKVLGSRNG